MANTMTAMQGHNYGDSFVQVVTTLRAYGRRQNSNTKIQLLQMEFLMSNKHNAVYLPVASSGCCT